MKRRYALFPLTLLLVGSVAGQPAPSVVVARLMIDVEGIEADFPSKAEGRLPRALEINEASRLADEVIEALRNPDSSPVKIAFDSVYSVVAEALIREFAFDILPLDTLRGAVPYVFGYPMGNTGKVAQTGSFGGALEIMIDVQVPDATQSSWSIFSTGKVRAKGRPEMELRVRYVQADGGGWKEKARVRSRSKVTVDEYWVLGIRKRSSTQADEALLPDLTREAAAQLIAKLRKRSQT